MEIKLITFQRFSRKWNHIEPAKMKMKGGELGERKKEKEEKQPNMDTAYVRFIVRIKCNSQYLQFQCYNF